MEHAGEFLALVELVAKYGDLGTRRLVNEATDYFFQTLSTDSLTDNNPSDK
jgi:hypothetical protein